MRRGTSEAKTSQRAPIRRQTSQAEAMLHRLMAKVTAQAAPGGPASQVKAHMLATRTSEQTTDSVPSSRLYCETLRICTLGPAAARTACEAASTVRMAPPAA